MRRVGNEAGDLAIERADANAALPRVVRRAHRSRLRVRAVNDVVLDEDAAQAAERIDGRDRLERLGIEDLDAVVRAIGHVEAALRVERQAMRLHELAFERAAHLAVFADELAGAIETDQACRCGRRVAVAFSDQDVAVRIGNNVVRLVERRGIGRLSGHVAARLAERQQDFALRRELDHLVAHHLRGHRGQWRIGRRTRRARGEVALTVGDPHVAVTIDVNAVREHEHALAEARHHLAVRIELEHGVERRHLALRAIPAAVGLAALGNPDAAAVLVDIDRAGRSPGAAFGHLGPAFNRVVRIGQIVRRCRRPPRLAPGLSPLRPALSGVEGLRECPAAHQATFRQTSGGQT